MNLNGFRGEKNKVRNRFYTARQFKNCARKCIIKTVCDKGIDFMKRW